MTERREPTISTLPTDKEEGPRIRAQESIPSSAAQSSRPVPPPVSARPVIVKSPLGAFSLIIALIGCGLSGFLYWQLQETQKRFDQSVAALASTEARVADLEKRLSLSGDEATQSMAVIQANVKENASEIRKLWGVANDRNRKAISSLETKTAALEKTLGTVDGKIKKALGEVSGELKVVSELVEAQQALVNSADKAVKSQTQNMSALTKKVDQLDADLRKKVQSHEEAIKSIDAFRVQVNRELLQLKGG